MLDLLVGYLLLIMIYIGAGEERSSSAYIVDNCQLSDEPLNMEVVVRVFCTITINTYIYN
jgi:hypothetical protein